MFRRMTLSIFGGALLAVVFAFSQTAMADCGYCAATRPGGLVLDSCALGYGEFNGIGFFYPICYYTSEPVIMDVPVT